MCKRGGTKGPSQGAGQEAVAEPQIGPRFFSVPLLVFGWQTVPAAGSGKRKAGLLFGNVPHAFSDRARESYVFSFLSLISLQLFSVFCGVRLNIPTK